MASKRLSNPKNFCEEARKLDIRYEYLTEAKICIGGQKLAQMFIGKSIRGGGDSLSSATIESWLNTFIYVQNNPDEEDKDQYSARRFEPRESWYKFVELIKTPIDDLIVKSWKNLSNKKLGDTAEKYGITLGTRNANAVKTLYQRMLDMVERRKKNIWDKLEELTPVEVDGGNENKIDYKFKNVPELRRICKERNLQNAHIIDKDGLIELLEKNPFNAVYNTEVNNIYSMTHPELKSLAKERGFNEYNNVSKAELVKMHEEYEIEMKRLDEEREKEENESILDTFEFEDKVIRIIRHNNEPWFIAKDICDALEISNNRDALLKIPDKWKAVGKSDTLGGEQEMSIINEPAVYKIIMRSNKPNTQVFQNKVCEEILPAIRKKGYYKVDERDSFPFQDNRPTIRRILDLSELDIEAELLEIEYDWTKWTNKCVLYIVYIGEGLIKLGFSDHKLDKRELKHQSSESNFKQYRMVKVIEISGKIAEDKMKELLNVYRVKFHNQHEIFRPPSTIANFIENVENLLRDNDLHMIISKQQQEIAELKLRVCEMEKKNLELQLQLR
jgi:prophage antirepressor-like protein